LDKGCRSDDRSGIASTADLSCQPQRERRPEQRFAEKVHRIGIRDSFPDERPSRYLTDSASLLFAGGAAGWSSSFANRISTPSIFWVFYRLASLVFSSTLSPPVDEGLYT
jgi:hypothetical protein